MKDYFRLGWTRTQHRDLITSPALKDQLVELDAILIHVSAATDEIQFISKFQIPIYLSGGTAGIEEERLSNLGADERDKRRAVKSVAGKFFPLTENAILIGGEGWPISPGEMDFHWLDVFLRAIAKRFDNILVVSSDKTSFSGADLESQEALEIVLSRFCKDHSHIRVTLLNSGAGNGGELQFKNLHLRRLHAFLPFLDIIHLPLD